MRYAAPAFAFLFALAFLPLPSLAATLSVIPSTTSVTTNDVVTVRVTVNPAGTAINNAEAILHFPAGVLQVLSISKTSSVFPLWVEGPDFSNADGTVSFNGGIPNPGITVPGTALSITFHAVHPGTATLSLTDAAVRANDGMGTNVLSSVSGTQIQVATAPQAPSVPVAPPASAQPVAAVPSAPSSGSILITSSTHPDQDAWYANATPAFAWQLPANATAVQLGVDASPNATPAVNYATPIEGKTVDSLADGTWYFRMRYRAGGTWSAISTYKVRIDTSTPTIVSHDFIYDGSQDALLVTASGTDAGSGIARYEVSIDGAAPTTVAATAFDDGAQPFPVRAAGIHTITLAAVDAAGNRTTLSRSFSVPPPLTSQTLFHIGSLSVSLLAVLIALMLFSLLALLLALLESLALMKYRSRRHPALPVVRKDMHRGFLKIKSNMELDIRSLDRARTKRELSREEGLLYRRLVENVNALERHLDEKLTDMS